MSKVEGILDRKARKNKYINPIMINRDKALSGIRLMPNMATKTESTIGYNGPWNDGYIKE